MFTITPLRNKIIKTILNNPVPNRHTNILSPYFILSTTLFFGKYKSVILDELYNKGLIELHGDVDLFSKANKISETKYLNLSASITSKGMAYYNIYIKKEAPEARQEFRFKSYPATSLRLVL